jgi:hypothetical protein
MPVMVLTQELKVGVSQPKAAWVKHETLPQKKKPNKKPKKTLKAKGLGVWLKWQSTIARTIHTHTHTHTHTQVLVTTGISE